MMGSAEGKNHASLPSLVPRRRKGGKAKEITVMEMAMPSSGHFSCLPMRPNGRARVTWPSDVTKMLGKGKTEKRG